MKAQIERHRNREKERGRREEFVSRQGREALR